VQKSAIDTPDARPKRFIGVAGNIGVGKSSLTGILAEALGWKPFYEAKIRL